MNPITEPFDQYADQYEEWFKKNECAYKSELKAVKNFIPNHKKGLEVGVGSGKFAIPLGIQTGVEPSKEMRKLAKEKGLEVYEGIGEDLPFEADSFDFVLMVTTICFLSDINKTFTEIRRILKNNGRLIIGFVDKNSSLGQVYQTHKTDNVFYKKATFYSAEQVIHLLKKHNFSGVKIVQTVFGELSEINEVQQFQRGYGQGGFVVIKADK